MQKSLTKKPLSNRKRRGVATVELAVCLPVVVLLVVGSIECCGMIFLKQALASASYEGIRVAVMPDATQADVEQRCQDVLTARDINDATVTISPMPFEPVTAGNLITVTVSAPSSTHRLISSNFFPGGLITSSAVMLKE